MFLGTSVGLYIGLAVGAYLVLSDPPGPSAGEAHTALEPNQKGESQDELASTRLSAELRPDIEWSMSILRF